MIRLKQRPFTRSILLACACSVAWTSACSTDADDGKDEGSVDVSQTEIDKDPKGKCGEAGGTLVEFIDADGEVIEAVTICNGATGPVGRDGKSGKDGKNGKDGKSGKDGKNGKDGKSGKDGENGKDGKDGADGAPGPAGPAGGAGGQGEPGKDGPTIVTSPSTSCGDQGGVHIAIVDAEGTILSETDVCNGADAWTCLAELYADGFCDAGCGIQDIDCRAPTDLYVPPLGAREIEFLETDPPETDVANLELLSSFPYAAWFTDPDEDDLTEKVHDTVEDAAFKNQLPVLVAYYLPYRDCAQYSAGGAETPEEYKAWIDAFADGLDGKPAMVILEPDGLGIIPYNTTIYGAEDWCKPTVNEEPAPGATSEIRYELLNYAVDRLGAAGAAVYLDATHAAWLGVGEAAFRLHKAGVLRARGFFINVSNYHLTSHSEQFGEWVSACITAGTNGAPWAAGHFDWCPSQYNSALDYAVDYSPEYAATVTSGLANMMDGNPATTHYVIDTSRNGQGAFSADAYAEAPYSQPESVIGGLDSGNWCNPPGRGVGLLPALELDSGLLDAYLWIKVPGESDGSCDIAGGARAWDYQAYTDSNWVIADADRFDPLWGLVDPVAGAWFKEQAAELIELANPPLE